MIITKADLDALAIRFVNAMILEGPDNEQELHTLLALLDPEPNDDLEELVTEATEFIDKSYNVLSDMIDEFENNL